MKPKRKAVKGWAVVSTKGYGKGGLEGIYLTKGEVGKWVVENASISCKAIPCLITFPISKGKK